MARFQPWGAISLCALMCVIHQDALGAGADSGAASSAQRFNGLHMLILNMLLEDEDQDGDDGDYDPGSGEPGSGAGGGGNTGSQPGTPNPGTPAGRVTYYHNDVSGSPMMATNAAGNLAWKENYQPYGEKLNRQTAGNSNKIGFHGKPFDNNTGLSYMGARYYDPLLGRFLGIDPVGVDPENLHSFGRYTYANNNPYKYVDPDGRIPVPVVMFAVGAGLEFAAQTYQNGGFGGKYKWNEVAVAGMGAVFTGGIGNRLAQHALRGTITSAQAVRGTMLAGGAAGGAGSVANNVTGGEKIDLEKAAVATTGGAAGAGIGAKIGNSAVTALERIAGGRGANSHIAETTRSASGAGAGPVNRLQVGSSAGAQMGADVANTVQQKTVEKKIDESRRP